MNRTPDVELVLRDYLADDHASAPDHVLDVIEERIMRQPQQRSWRVTWRVSRMNSQLKPVLAVAAVVVVAVAGFAMFGRPSNSSVGGTGSPSPSPSPSASASPSPAGWAAAVRDGHGAGILPQGSGTTRAFIRGSTFSVPEGWINQTDTTDYFGLFPGTPANEAEFAVSRGPAQNIFMGVVDSPSGLICDGVGDADGPTAADLADSLVANKALVTSEPVAVTIGELTGIQIDAHLDPAWTGSCRPGPDDPPTRDFTDGRRRFVILDIPTGGKLLIIIDSVHSADFERFLGEAMPIVESFRFAITP